VPPEAVRAAVAALTADEIAEQRWFGSKGSDVGPIALAGAVGPFGETEWLLALAVGDDTYLIPAQIGPGRVDEARGPLWRALAEVCCEGGSLAGDGLEIRGAAGPMRPPRVDDRVRPLGIDQSNTSVVLGERLVLKCYRRLTAGEHPEIEVVRYLADHGLACLPSVYGSADVRVGDAPPAGALLLQEYIADGKDGWLAAEDELRALLEADDVDAATAAPARWAPAIGEATAEVHALLAVAEAPGFTPRPAGRTDLTELRVHAEAQLEHALGLLDGPARATLAAAAAALRTRFALFESVEPPLLTRVHGDLHLGQFLHRDADVPALVDFEGDPTREAAERRRRASPLRDLASLLRSVDHAANWVSHTCGEETGPVATTWIDAARRSIRSAYERRLRELAAPLTVDPQLLAAFEAEKAVGEFVYAARFLPSWLDVPRRALASAISRAPAGSDRPRASR
jgi:trehalose synthase-fused probable maltokinase